MRCLMNMFAESGVIGGNAPLSAVADCKLVNSASSMETNVALIALMAMETKNNDLATSRHAQSIARGVGASTVPAPQLAVGESRTGCTASPGKPLMAAKLAQRQVVSRRAMLAAQNDVRSIVRAIGRIGVCAPMVVLVQT